MNPDVVLGNREESGSPTWCWETARSRDELTEESG